MHFIRYVNTDMNLFRSAHNRGNGAVEYAKADIDDMLIRITAHNRGPEATPLDLLPTIWFRNTWSWGYDTGPMGDVPGRPVLKQLNGPKPWSGMRLSHPAAGKIICISSVHEAIPWAGHVNYAASKGGVMLMMKSIAQEVTPYRIKWPFL